MLVDPGLDTLLTALRGAGLRVGVDEVLRLRHVFSLAPDLDGEGLRQVIAGVVVKSREDLEAFAPVFEAWVVRAGSLTEPHTRVPPPEPKHTTSGPPPPATGPAKAGSPAHRARRWIGERFALVLFAAPFAAGLYYLWHHPPLDRSGPPSASSVPAAGSALATANPPPSPPDGGNSRAATVNPPPPDGGNPLPVMVNPPPPDGGNPPPVTVNPSPPDGGTPLPVTVNSPPPDEGNSRRATLPAQVLRIEPVERPPLGWGAAVLVLLAVLAIWGMARRPPKLAVPPGSAGKPVARGRRAPFPAAGGPELLDLRDEDAIVWGVGRFVGEDATTDLELDATVEATAGAAGFPDLRFRRARHPREVWLWIDESAEDTTLPRVAREIADALRRAGLPVEEATFWGVPDRLRTADGAEITPGELDDRRDAALVAILTDGRLLAKLHASEGDRRFLAPLLRALSHWPRLGVVDFADGATKLPGLLRRHGIARVAPERLAAFLGAEADAGAAKGARGGPGRDDLVWAAACALAPEPIDEAQAHALRRRLGGGPSPWGIRALAGAERGAGGKLSWPRRRRAELLRWLLRAERLGPEGEISTGGTLGKAIAFWTEVYRDEAARHGPFWKVTAAERENRMRRALLALWTDPAGAAGALYAIWEGDVGRAISGHLAWLAPADAGGAVGDEGVVLPWRMADQAFETRETLEAMGLGKCCGVRRTAWRGRRRAWVAVGVCAGVAVGVGEPWVVWLRSGEHEVSGKGPEGVLLQGLGNQCPEEMAWISGGTFRMGAEDGDDDEKPVHAVSVGGFCLDLTEVTVTAYTACVREGRCSAEHLREYSLDGTTFSPDRGCNYEVDGKEPHPINCVDWKQAEAYCASARKRLPTEEEWEYVARGGDDQRTYPWGDEPPLRQVCWNGEGNYLGKGKRASTCEVGEYKAGDSRWGVHDLAGNVWEWTSSPYCVPYPKDGVSTCANENRVQRGGSWLNDVASHLRAASRGGDAPAGRFDGVGFRCARTMP